MRVLINKVEYEFNAGDKIMCAGNQTVCTIINATLRGGLYVDHPERFPGDEMAGKCQWHWTQVIDYFVLEKFKSARHQQAPKRTANKSISE